MKSFKIFVVALLIITTANSLIAKTVSVKGYYRKNGTYVRPHTRNVNGDRNSKSSKNRYGASYSSEEWKSNVSGGSSSAKVVHAASKEEETRIRLNSIDDALMDFRFNHNRLPKSLIELYREPGINIKLSDGWGNKLKYVLSSSDYSVSSAGKDGKHGTADDIKSARSL